MTAEDTRSLTQLAAEINRLQQLIFAGHKTAFEHAAEIGQMLNQAKKLNGKHGEWLEWLRRSCPDLAETTARLYMRIADKGPELEAAAKANGQRVADLTVRGAARLLAKPKPDGAPRQPSKAASKGPASPDLKVLLKNVGADELVAALREAAWDGQEIRKLVLLLSPRRDESPTQNLRRVEAALQPRA